ncbi:FKBP-type peptidyl-prolyl cis-trans isomerase [Natronoflexus pectinivorans]|uniref:Peptidyl-prolyl cis-trans isomerase n=1 Tax=Natronoflexus pectinivorans TaxID=682526 RepID=A0A4R2GIS6_9BACT|nr:FKBP-type peptidyl-prolyl cis-trans isomerase [Natronoflexus pectinivorans]TCO08295.1 FKBP-type peptidyl-prolyl cis-trans isomerase FkpA/FKBP-type peptidyl-prolyl cis-trans isomerase FklB [Natronoflexus pectinivorans]
MAKRDKKQRSKGSAGNNRKSGDDFLLQNAQKPGVVETESGLQYLVVEESSGEKPHQFSTVEIHQRALLLNGTLLEDTYRANQTSTVPLNELIEGLQEGLQLMSVGSRCKFWVPYDLAWGKKGTGNKIPPFAVLHFDIRLVGID